MHGNTALIAERMQQPARRGGQRRMPLDGIDMCRQLCQHRGRIAGAGADLQHAVCRTDARCLRHGADNKRLRNGLFAGDRQRRVLVREFLHRGRHEDMARHSPPRRQHTWVANTTSPQLQVDHGVAPRHRALVAGRGRRVREVCRGVLPFRGQILFGSTNIATEGAWQG